ncbi:Protein phosphatase 1, regulatory subunit, and related proteins [Ceraceosorus bombacis]|uniref:Protein phosphatase 1, regulatory subunit, and related proteins n=1 Tax=Ceraceosorus bombacis TaxID=401625 RepID=A0A0P1BGC2_9BASI|nr:Protein phosphatase 1, regulatory subunit, and related proteins [Ceraceosorus bombacis]
MRHLNLDHNLLSKLPALQAMRRLKRLSLVGCRIKRPTSLIDALAGMSELSVLDLRLNPCTLGLYPPLLLSSATPVISDEATHERSRRPPASMPPFPDPGVVQPDRAAAVLREAKRAERAAQQQIEKSVFHKRQPGPDLDAPRGKRWSDDEQDETEVSQGLSTISSKHDVGLDAQQKMMAAADARFAQTLPPTFAYRRLMHRGSLAMACPALAWLDGLLVDEAEVVKADELLSASPPFASGAFLSSSPHT